MVKIKIDEKECIGCGLCSSICPDTFEIVGSKAKVKKKEVKKVDCEKDAEQSCPTKAIKLS